MRQTKPPPAPARPPAHDYSSGDVSEKDKVVMVVRSRSKYGQATAGELVKIDRDELRRGPTAEALCSPEEYQATLKAAADRKAQAEAPKPAPVRDAIQGALERMWSGGAAGGRRTEG